MTSCRRESRRFLRRGFCLIAAVASACHPAMQSQPVGLQGNRSDIRRLAGTWTGEFHNRHTGKVGTIFFDLRADSDTAYGRVTFNHVTPVAACADMTRPQESTSIVVPIVLRFGALAVFKGSIGGWLQPYRDPDLLCWMDTWFEGRLVRDTLSGSFFSRRTDTDSVRQGSWWAARVH